MRNRALNLAVLGTLILSSNNSALAVGQPSIPSQFRGLWAPRPSACFISANQLDPIEQGALKITAQGIDGFEVTSKVERIIKTDAASVTFNSREAGEGDGGTWRTTVILRLTGRGLNVSRGNASAHSTNYTKCGASPPNAEPAALRALPMPASAIAEIKREYPRAGKCRLIVDRETRMDGLCRFTIEKDGSFTAITPNGSDFVMVEVDHGVAPRSFWNGGGHAEKALVALGSLRRSGACWSNSHVEICLRA